MANEQIRIGVDYSEFSSGIQSIKSQAEALAQDMIRQASEQGKTGVAALEIIEKQIKALERRNQLESEVAKSELRQEYNAGNVGSKEFAGEMKEQRGIDQDQKLIVQLLKDLVQTTREASHTEITQDKILAEREDTRQDLGIGGGIAGAALVDLVKSGDKGESTEVEPEARKPHGRLGESLRTSTEVFFDVMKAPNAYEATMGAGKQIAGLMAAQGGLLGKVGMMAGATISHYEQAFKYFKEYDSELTSVQRLGGGALGDLSGYGVNKIQAIQEEKNIMRARGTAVNYGTATSESFQLQKGYGMDSGVVYGLANILRSNTREYGSYDKAGLHISKHDAAGQSSSLTKWAEMAQGSAEESGVTQRGDTNILPEYLNVLIGIGREQLLATGEVSMGINTRMVNAVTHLDNSFKNPEVLSHVYGGIKGMLEQSSSPNVQALQYSVLSKMKKDDGSSMSMWEMNKAMADPMNFQGGKYRENFMQAIRDMSGGNREMTLFNAQALMPGTGPELIERMFYGNHDVENDKGGMIPSRKANVITTDIEKEEAKKVDKWIGEGADAKVAIDEALKRMDDIRTAVSNIVDFLKGTFKETQEHQAHMKKMGKDMIDQGNVITGTIIYRSASGGAFMD